MVSFLRQNSHKNAEIINKIGQQLEKDNNIKWLISDFKKEEGYKKSIKMSIDFNLYRQHYCGCIFSYQNKK